MKFNRTGIIVYVINYQECVNFYENIIGLKKMFEGELLSCFKFGDSYLMVEFDSEFNGNDASGRIRTCLRMNVEDVRTLADELIAKGVKVDYQEHSWGDCCKVL